VRQRVRVQPQVVRRQRVVVDQPCPSGTTQQSDGTCLSAPRVVREPAPTVIRATCPSGTTDLGKKQRQSSFHLAVHQVHWIKAMELA